MGRLTDKLIAKLKRKITPYRKKQIQFPSKSGQDSVNCLGLLDIYGSLFCLDNNNILFKDTNGESKVLKPVSQTNADTEDEFGNLDAYETDDGFAIRWQGIDYHYQAHFEIVPIIGKNTIKIHDIKQSIFNVSTKAGCIVVSS